MHPLITEQIAGVEIVARASEDYLKLFIDARRKEKKVGITRTDIINLLKRIIHERQIDTKVIDELISAFRHGAEEVLNRRVAVGEPPQAGKDGHLVVLVKTFSGAPEETVRARENAKLTQLYLFDNVEKGQVIARIYSPTPAIDGVDIFGKPISAIPGNPVTVQFDHTLSMESAGEGEGEYQVLRARDAGYLTIHEGRYRISSTLRIEADLDFHWGDIDFVGGITIHGDIMQGFTIKAREGIEIYGSVRGGSLIATEGHIRVSEYAFGGPKSLILAGKDFIASVAQEVTAEVLGDIYIRKEANNCNLRTPGAVYMSDANLLGGEVFTSHGVEAKTIGASSGIKTIITLSSDVETSLAYSKTIVALEVVQKDLALLELQLGPIAGDRSKALTLPPASYEKIRSSVERYEALLAKRRALQSQKLMMITDAELQRIITVNFHESMHEGVIIRCQGREYVCTETIEGPHSLDFEIKAKSFSLRPQHALRSQAQRMR